jgi:hypothetical protein
VGSAQVSSWRGMASVPEVTLQGTDKERDVPEPRRVIPDWKMSRQYVT